VPLEKIPYVDYPEILINEHERTEMPFRYVTDAQGEPIMPDVSDSSATKYVTLQSVSLAHLLSSGDGGSD
jgi:ribosome biogenesis SPOUT family RNA methylase Rps3